GLIGSGAGKIEDFLAGDVAGRILGIAAGRCHRDLSRRRESDPGVGESPVSRGGGSGTRGCVCAEAESQYGQDSEGCRHNATLHRFLLETEHVTANEAARHGSGLMLFFRFGRAQEPLSSGACPESAHLREEVGASLCRLRGAVKRGTASFMPGGGSALVVVDAIFPSRSSSERV